MKELDLLDRVRPDVRPLDEPERAAMRAGLFGTLSDTPEQHSVSAATSVALAYSPSRPRRTARRTVLVAAALVLLAVSATWGLLARRTNPPSDQQPAPTTVATTIATPADATAQLEPTQAYWAAVWTAREIVIGQCMAQSGYEYLPRPFGSDASTKQDEWQAWFDQQVANDPTFKTTMLGAGNQQAGGCQLEAFTTVHGPGEEAYSKMSTLLNEMLADLPTDAERTTANITAWIDDHHTQVEDVRAELDEEQATAEAIINTANSTNVTTGTTGDSLPETQAIEMDDGMLSYAVPADAVTDPTAQGTLPHFVIGYARWVTDCCLLRLAVENINPPMPDEEAIATFTANGLEWTVYDSGPRDGTQMIGKATSALGTVLISAQVGPSQQNADPGAAQRLVEQVARTAVLVPAK